MLSNSGRVDIVYLVNNIAANKIPAKTLKSLGLNMISADKQFHSHNHFHHKTCIVAYL